MNPGRSVLAQLVESVESSHLQNFIEWFGSDRGIHGFLGQSHFLCIAYSQLTRRDGSRDPMTCVGSPRTRRHYNGICGKVVSPARRNRNPRP